MTTKQTGELRRVHILMPPWMLTDMRERASKRGITVTEYIRRAVSLQRMLDDSDAQIVLRHEDKPDEVLRLL